MNVQVRPFSPIPVVMLNHVGPYEGLSGEFDRLWDWTQAQGVPAGRLIGIYYNNPDVVSASRLRSAACVEVAASFMVGDRGGLPLERSQIAGGEYATTRFNGPYEDLAAVWSQFTAYVEGTLGRTIREDPAYEVYVNDPSDTPPDALVTELYMPVF